MLDVTDRIARWTPLKAAFAIRDVAPKWILAAFERRLASEATWIMLAHAAVSLAGLVGLRAFTELAPRSVFGSANLLLGVLAFSLQMLLSPILQSQLRYHVLHKEAGYGDHYARLIARSAGIAALSVVLVVTLVMSFWPPAREGAEKSVILWLAGWVGISAYRAVVVTRAQAERDQKRYATWIGVEAVLLVACTCAMLLVWPTVEGYIAGQFAGVAIAALVLVGRPMTPSAAELENSGASRREAWRQIRSYGLPFIAFALIGWLSNLSDRYVLAAKLDLAAVGQYVAAFGIASRLPTVLAAPLGDLFRPALFEAQCKKDLGRARRVFVLWLASISAISGAMVVVVDMFGDQIAAIMLAENYRPGARNVMFWIAIGYGLFSMGQVIENRVLSFGASKALVWTKTFGAAANLFLAALLIPMLGVVGAAVANACGHGVQLAATCVMAWRFGDGAPAGERPE